jgi:hypothetical protein
MSGVVVLIVSCGMTLLAFTVGFLMGRGGIRNGGS